MQKRLFFVPAPSSEIVQIMSIISYEDKQWIMVNPVSQNWFTPLLKQIIITDLIENISKVIFRHANLSTTQRYLGKVSDTEAIQWIENIYG